MAKARIVPGAAAALLASAVGWSAATAQEPVLAVTTIGMIADVAETVAGDCARVEALMGPGVDPHLYQASAGDVRLFRDADAIFYSGYSLEGQLGTVLERLASQKPTVAVSPVAIDPANLITVQDVYGIDPHLWMDAGLWQQIAPVIAATLAEIVPDCDAAMQARAEAYQVQIQALDGWIRESIATIPDQQRILVTAHDAFNYYGRAYDIAVAGIQGISTESEAGVADIRDMVDVVVERGVPAVFIESTINPRTIRAVIESAAERGHEVTIGGELYSDAMGEAGTVGGTYIGMLYENTVTIVEALGGSPAPLPEALAGWAESWGIDPAAPGAE
ncbi:MAG: zinc ABC transporter solute-binding protein [Alphaproteobacteria bacterium]|jgi:manganese/zinc/iron transport system substrate-binding protein|nr:zinc ABC transporter solute-binding protein [Alphaproteobacteria bacterium]